MRTICICNNKGGTGKTTTALTFAQRLNDLGKSVLFVDLDQQKNATKITEAKTDNVPTIYDVLMGEDTARDAIQHWQHGDIIPGDTLVADAEADLSRLDTPLTMLDDALTSISDTYDFTVVDTPPSLGYVTRNALVASSDCIVVVNPVSSAIDGLSGINEVITKIKFNRRLNPNISIIGILINNYNKQGILDRACDNQLPQFVASLNIRLFSTRIRKCVKIPQSISSNKTLLDYAPKCNAAIDFKSVVDQYLEFIKN